MQHVRFPKDLREKAKKEGGTLVAVSIDDGGLRRTYYRVLSPIRARNLWGRIRQYFEGP